MTMSGKDPATDPQGGTGAEPGGEGGKPRDAEHWKAQARLWEKRATDNQAAADELEQLKESQKSELQKARGAAQAARDELEKLKAEREAETARAKVSSETGVPADLIAGDTEEEMRDFAARVAAHYKADPAPKVPSAGKIAREPAADPKEAAKRELAGRIFKNREEGN